MSGRTSDLRKQENATCPTCGDTWHRRKDCTCLGACMKRAGSTLGDGWRCALDPVCPDPFHALTSPAPPTPTDEAVRDDDGYTDEECPAWNHPEADTYVICLRCDHYQDDCPHECGPEFTFLDVADSLEWRAQHIATLEAVVEAHREVLPMLIAEHEANQHAADALAFGGGNSHAFRAAKKRVGEAHELVKPRLAAYRASLSALDTGKEG